MINLPDGIKFGTLTKEKCHDMWMKLKDHEILFSDDTNGNELCFFNHMWSENSIFFEIEGGFVIFTKLIEGLSAQAHAVFYDSKLSPRTEKMKELVAWMMLNHDLHRIECVIPDMSKALYRWLTKRVNMKEEGKLRNSLWYKGRLHDKIILSIIREEVLDGWK